MQNKLSCHCGKNAFTFAGEIGEVLACNCSMCQRRGSLLWFIPRAQLRALTPESDLGTYTFNKHAIRHRFCPICGIHLFGEATGANGLPMAAINARCVEGLDVDGLAVKHFDGRAL